MHNVHVGTMGWSYDFWKGRFYPENLQSNELLTYYSSKFDTVEVDNTFYRIPTKQTFLRWKEQTPNGFIFSLKFPRIITHFKMLKNCEEETRVFLERVELLGEKLGPLLLQFPSSFRVENIVLLNRFLESLPQNHHYVVEVRDKKLLEKSFYSMLRNNNAALAWVDSASVPTVTDVTSDFIYIRWEGDRKKVKGTMGKIELNRKANLQVWAAKMKPFVNNLETFGYFSKYYSGDPPSDISLLLNLLA
jgi:uncharacterized protein YecE (DUF72 family)